MTMKMISIAMATYNSEKYLREQLDSIFAQTKDIDFEVIVSDNVFSEGVREMICTSFLQLLGFISDIVGRLRK